LFFLCFILFFSSFPYFYFYILPSPPFLKHAILMMGPGMDLKHQLKKSNCWLLSFKSFTFCFFCQFFPLFSFFSFILLPFTLFSQTYCPDGGSWYGLEISTSKSNYWLLVLSFLGILFSFLVFIFLFSFFLFILLPFSFFSQTCCLDDGSWYGLETSTWKSNCCLLRFMLVNICLFFVDFFSSFPTFYL